MHGGDAAATLQASLEGGTRGPHRAPALLNTVSTRVLFGLVSAPAVRASHEARSCCAAARWRRRVRAYAAHLDPGVRPGAARQSRPAQCAAGAVGRGCCWVSCAAGALRACAGARGWRRRRDKRLRQVARLHRRRPRALQPGACASRGVSAAGLSAAPVQGKLDEAERYLRQALREARLGFDSKDAHVAAALNNLAEVYRCAHPQCASCAGVACAELRGCAAGYAASMTWPSRCTARRCSCWHAPCAACSWRACGTSRRC